MLNNGHLDKKVKIDYVSRGEFLPAATRVAKELGADDPLVTLQEVIPSFEFLAQHVNHPWCLFVDDDGGRTTALSLYTAAKHWSPTDEVFARPFQMTLEIWMRRHGFRDEWIADNAAATVTRYIISGMEDPTGARTLKWTRSLDPEAGRVPFLIADDPEWQFERTQSAAAYGREAQKWFSNDLKRIKAEIQYCQGERFDYKNAAYNAAKRFAGLSYPQIAGDQIDPDTVRKGVNAYCARTGLSLPGETSNVDGLIA